MIINKEVIIKGPESDIKVMYHHNNDKRLRFDHQWAIDECINLSTNRKVLKENVWVPDSHSFGEGCGHLWEYLMEVIEDICSFESETFFDYDGHIHMGKPEDYGWGPFDD